MEAQGKFGERYVAFLLKHRIKTLLLIAAATGFFCFEASRLKIATDFFTLYPPNHPYIQLYKQYRSMFGSANVLVVAVEVKEGAIYTVETIAKIDRITKMLMTTEGCDPFQLISITHPKLKNVQVSAWGISVTPVMHLGLPRDDEALERIKTNVYTNEGIRGFFVSPDDKTAAIFAGFWEEGTDPFKIYKRMQAIKASEEDVNTKIHFVGYPALYAYIYHLLPEIRNVLILTGILLVGLLFYYFRNWQGVLFPVISGAVSAVWGLGFASLLGYTLDPLILVVPLIITARTLSHTVQFMARYHEEYIEAGDQKEAIVKGYGALWAPCLSGVLTDAVGLFLISIATIPLMRRLGFFGSFWVLSVFVSVPTLTPIILSYFRPPDAAKLQREIKGRVYTMITRLLVRPSATWGRWVILGLIAIIIVFGGNIMRKTTVGNTEAGAAVLFADHPYNRSFKFFNRNFVGATQFVIIVEGKEDGAIKNPEVLRAMEDFQRYMETEGMAGGTLTFTNIVKRINRMFHEGHPKWEKVPRAKKAIGEIAFIVESNASPGEMDRWIDQKWKNATITCFYRNYNFDLIKQVVGKAKEYIESNPLENVRFRLAGGLLGILAAVNEEVYFSYWASLFAVFTACFLLSWITFRSSLAAVIIILPLAVSQVLCELFMRVKGIDLNINSIPVAAIAVGIGIDYGFYLLARISEEYQHTGDYLKANDRAVATTGKAIAFTATTIIAGVFFWIFVDLKFQAEMGLLLVLLMFLNMAGAMLFIPSLVVIFRPAFVRKRRL